MAVQEASPCVPEWICRRPGGRQPLGAQLSLKCCAELDPAFSLDPGHLQTRTQENTYKSKREGNYGTFM